MPYALGERRYEVEMRRRKRGVELVGGTALSKHVGYVAALRTCRVLESRKQTGSKGDWNESTKLWSDPGPVCRHLNYPRQLQYKISRGT